MRLGERLKRAGGTAILVRKFVVRRRGKGIHDFAPPVAGFIDSIFEQIALGKNEPTFGFTEQVSKAGTEILNPTFDKIKQVT